MIIKNGLVFYKGKFEKKDFRVSNGIFESIGEPGTLKQMEGEQVLDADGKRVLPGLVDIHSHGRAGADFSFADQDALERMSASYAASGVTAILATTMSNEPEEVKQAVASIREFCDKNEAVQTPMVKIIGIHMEGPFLSEKKKGAHDPRNLLAPDVKIYEEMQSLSGHRVRLMVIAPELPGTEEFIHRCKKDGVTVSLGHTACDYDLACKAADWGVDHVTHLFNAMQPLHHREPGLIGAAVDKEMYVEVICDGIHLHPAIIRMMFLLCPEKVVLISDSMPAAGLSDGEYELGGIKVHVKGGKATQEDGTIAGSTINVYEAMVNAIRFGVPEEQAVLSASYIPAKSVKTEDKVGCIAVGRNADFILVDEDWNLEKVYINGKFVN